MNYSAAATAVRDITQTAIMIGGAIVAWRYLMHLGPRVDMSLSSSYLTARPDMCLLRVDIRNASRVRMTKEYVRIQAIFYTAERAHKCSEYVPFSLAKVRPGEMPDIWNSPQDVCMNTEAFYPNETLSFDYPLVFPAEAVIAHVAVQTRVTLKWSERIRSALSTVHEQWTITRFVQRSPEQMAQPSPSPYSSPAAGSESGEA